MTDYNDLSPEAQEAHDAAQARRAWAKTPCHTCGHPASKHGKFKCFDPGCTCRSFATAPQTIQTEEPQTMTTQPQTPDRITAAEMRALIADLKDEIAHLAESVTTLAADLAQIKTGLTHAAATPAAPLNLEHGWVDFIADQISLDYSEGRPMYKARGGQFTKFGVRIWPEILPALGIDPASLKPGPNTLPAPLMVRAALNESGQPRKVISLA